MSLTRLKVGNKVLAVRDTGNGVFKFTIEETVVSFKLSNEFIGRADILNVKSLIYNSTMSDARTIARFQGIANEVAGHLVQNVKPQIVFC